MSLTLRPYLLAAAGGVLYCLGFVGFGIWPLSLICLVPLWLALEETVDAPWWRAAAVGFLFAWVAYALGYTWLWRIVDVFLRGNVALGAAFWLADSFWFALRFALYALLYRGVRRRGSRIGPTRAAAGGDGAPPSTRAGAHASGATVMLAAVPPLLAIEWLYPLLFPVHLGHALVQQTTFIQISDLGGPLLATALVGLINLAVFATWNWCRGRCPRPTRIWTTAMLAVVAAWGYGTARIEALERAMAAAPTLRVGLVQGNLGLMEKGEAEVAHRRYLEQTRELLAEGEVDIVVWPETVYTRGLRGPLPISGHFVREDLGVPLLFGGVLVRTDSGRRLKYNSALLVGTDGVIRTAYDKNLLIPFTEYVPFADLFASARAWFADASEFSAAGEVPPVALGPWRISTPICYEVVRPAFVRRMVSEADPHLIVTLANDAWFGDSPEPWIHLTMARLRAIEHRRYLVRATNSGVSAVVDPIGREVARTGLLTRENLRATVRLLDQPTLYTTLGDWPGWIAVVLVLAALAWKRPSTPRLPRR